MQPCYMFLTQKKINDTFIALPAYKAERQCNLTVDLHRKTQNKNESRNATNMERLPKIQYVSQVRFGTYDAVLNVIIGRKNSYSISC